MQIAHLCKWLVSKVFQARLSEATKSPRGSSSTGGEPDGNGRRMGVAARARFSGKWMTLEHLEYSVDSVGGRPYILQIFSRGGVRTTRMSAMDAAKRGGEVHLEQLPSGTFRDAVEGKLKRAARWPLGTSRSSGHHLFYE